MCSTSASLGDLGRVAAGCLAYSPYARALRESHAIDRQCDAVGMINAADFAPVASRTPCGMPVQLLESPA